MHAKVIMDTLQTQETQSTISLQRNEPSAQYPIAEEMTEGIVSIPAQRLVTAKELMKTLEACPINLEGEIWITRKEKQFPTKISKTVTARNNVLNESSKWNLDWTWEVSVVFWLNSDRIELEVKLSLEAMMHDVKQNFEPTPFCYKLLGNEDFI